MLLRTSISALSLTALPAVAFADPHVELGLAVGGHDFSHSSELGTYDDPSYPGASSGAMEGARIGVAFKKRFAVEGEAMVVESKDDVLGMPATVFGLRAHLRVDVLTGHVRPFVLAGAGELLLQSSSHQLFNDYDAELHWGIGLLYAVSDHVDFRIDARQMMVPDRTVISARLNGATFDYESTVGFSYRFGSTPKPPTPAPAIEPEPEPEPVAEPAPAPPPPPPPPAPKPEPIPELAGIGFELDSAKITVASRPILERAYNLLETHPKVSVEIAGHTSSEGNPARNLALSLARAEAVKAFLVAHGISAERIMTVGHGSDDPVADNDTDAGRRQNRRIEFRIVDDGEAK